MKRRRRPVMLGSAFEVRGGVSAVARVLDEEGFFERTRGVYLATHCDGSAARKAWQALRAWLAFMAMLVRGRASLLHAHLNSDASFWRKALFVLPARLFGVPYVLQVHCGRFTDFYRGSAAPLRAFIRWVLKGARTVVALSESSRLALDEAIPGLPMQVISNPVAIPTWQAPLTEGPPTVLFLGMITGAKGVFDLLRAWPKVLEAVPTAELVLAGTGEIDRVREVARLEGFEDTVHVPGWIDGKEKISLLRRAWVVTLPSHHEAMPMSLLEAQAAGIPVVASRVGGVPDIVVDGQTGLMCLPRDTRALAQWLVRLLQDQELRLAFGRAGRARAQREFSVEGVMPRLETLWDEATGTRPPAGSGAFFSSSNHAAR